METEKNERLNRTNAVKSPVRQDGRRRAAKYNYADMEDVTIRAAEGFAERLARLRNAKGVSGREMSLSMGQAAGYVNNIENGNNLPSLAMFFEICEYLGVTPREFFSYTRPGGDAAAWDALQRLSPDDRALVIRLAERLGEERR